MPRSLPPTLLNATYSSDNLFPNEMEMDSETQDKNQEKSLSTPKETGMWSEYDNRDSPFNRLSHDTEVAKEPLSSSPSTEQNDETPSLEQKYSEELVTKESTDTKGGEGANSREVELRTKSHGSREETPPMLERRLSYQMATEDMEEMLEACLSDKTKDEHAKAKEGEKNTEERDKLATLDFTSKKKQTDSVKRSTSSIENTSQAAIKLRKNLGMVKSPRAMSSSCYPIPSALDRQSSGQDSAYFSLRSYMSPQSCLDILIDKEINTGSYSAPLIGCIPPSALKCFADEEEADKKSSAQSPLTSPTHSQSGM